MNTADWLFFLFGALVSAAMTVLMVMVIALRIEYGPWVVWLLYGFFGLWASKRPKRALAWGATGAIAVLIGLCIGVTMILIRYDLWDYPGSFRLTGTRGGTFIYNRAVRPTTPEGLFGGEDAAHRILAISQAVV